MGLNGKPKRWNISKIADRRAKLTIIWESGYYSAYMQGTFDARFLEFGLGSLDALCKIYDSAILKHYSLGLFRFI